MIDHLDNLLRHLFLAQIDEISDERQIRFQPPDADWRSYVANLTINGSPRNALNVYLVELKENRQRRSNERFQDIREGVVIERLAPHWLDCHYFITAWSPATVTEGVEPTLDEHALLYKVAAVLANNQPLTPRQVYGPGSLPATFPAVLADVGLATQVLTPEGFGKIGDFWNTVAWRWKPGVLLAVSLPLLLLPQAAGPMVTTRITEYRVADGAAATDIWIQIAGQTLDGAFPLADGSPAPLAGALVRLETPAGAVLQQQETDSQGRFTFANLRPGSYRLRARVQGRGEVLRDIQVPSPSGEYDLIY